MRYQIKVNNLKIKSLVKICNTNPLIDLCQSGTNSIEWFTNATGLSNPRELSTVASLAVVLSIRFFFHCIALIFL